jgi:hypothetical protein
VIAAVAGAAVALAVLVKISSPGPTSHPLLDLNTEDAPTTSLTTAITAPNAVTAPPDTAPLDTTTTTRRRTTTTRRATTTTRAPTTAVENTTTVPEPTTEPPGEPTSTTSAS